jgi:hypothetical protein
MSRFCGRMHTRHRGMPRLARLRPGARLPVIGIRSAPEVGEQRFVSVHSFDRVVVLVFKGARVRNS